MAIQENEGLLGDTIQSTSFGNRVILGPERFLEDCEQGFPAAQSPVLLFPLPRSLISAMV